MALAFDAASNGVNAVGTGLTYAHTCTGTDRILHTGVLVSGTTSDLISTVTFNGDSMSRPTGAEIAYATNNTFLAVYELVNPDEVTGNVVITLSSAAGKRSCSLSHTGAKQTSQPDVVGTGTQATSTSFTDSVTTTEDQCWILFFSSNDQGTTLDGTNYTHRTSSAGHNAGDGGPFATGATSQTANCGSSANWSGIQIGIKPAAAAAGVRPAMRMMMGVGR